jgi:hypothetical protein
MGSFTLCLVTMTANSILGWTRVFFTLSSLLPTVVHVLAGIPKEPPLLPIIWVRQHCLVHNRYSCPLQAYPKSHPFCQLSGSDNIVSYTTERYAQQPLIVRGPGAGAEGTAAGVFGDLLQLARCLGATV